MLLLGSLDTFDGLMLMNRVIGEAFILRNIKEKLRKNMSTIDLMIIEINYNYCRLILC